MAAVDPGLLRDALRGDPLAAALVSICDRLEALEHRPDATERLAYEASAGAQTEVRKLVAIEVRRQWTRIAPWLLAAVALGASLGWAAHSAGLP